MSDDPIDLAAARKSRRASYVDRDEIERLLLALEKEADHIAFVSHERFGAIDVLAHEITAHTTAIRRALAGETR